MMTVRAFQPTMMWLDRRQSSCGKIRVQKLLTPSSSCSKIAAVSGWRQRSATSRSEPMRIVG